MALSSGHLVRSDRGAAAVEFALVSILLMILVVGAVEMSRLYQAQSALAHAAREGARQAAVDHFDAAYVKQQASPLPPESVTVAMNESTDGEGNKLVRVTVSCPFSFWLVNPNWSTDTLSKQLSGTAEMRAEY